MLDCVTFHFHGHDDVSLSGSFKQIRFEYCDIS